jgi:cysteinyl-tRNA synthetase
MDFVLWKPSDPSLPGWDSPWGRGRPGWHIECSAMSHALLGGSFDIHGGGIDLMFPHHENEIAQSRCAHPGEDFARVWMHNGFLQVEGEKMSKSLGNFFTVRDLLDQGWPGEVIRFMLLRTHYRQPLDWSRDAAKEAMEELATWYRFPDFMKCKSCEPTQEVVAALADDLNTSEMLRVLRELAKYNHHTELSASLRFLGLTGKWFFDRLPPPEVSRQVSELVARLDALREARDYSAADRLRAELVAAGIEVRSSRGGSAYSVTTSFDPAKLKALQ